MLNYSKIDKNIVKDYGNKKLCKVIDLLNLFKKYNFKLNNKNFNYKFLNKRSNINKIKNNKNNIFKNKDSLKIFDQYLKNSINVKKLQNL